MGALRRQWALQFSSVPYIVMHPLVCMWRSNGIKAVEYLDYGIVSSQNDSSVTAASAWVRDTLSRAGWLCNQAKAVWVPTHKLCWLGFTLGVEKRVYFSTPEGNVRASTRNSC